MIARFKYGFLFLVLLIAGVLNVEAQVEVDVLHKKLQELKQLEKGYVEVDEIEPLIMTEVPQVNVAFVTDYKGATNMRLMKKMHKLTISKSFAFNVEEDYSDLSFMILGVIDSGSLNVRVLKPNKQILKELKLVPGNKQNWQQSFCLEENADNGFIGKWTVELSSNQATGYYQFISNSR